jgi:hypothetical protein
MRSRNREVNIFNMSLLDILTGMLGAFLFLMLGLVPYYNRPKKQPPPSQQQQQQQQGGSGLSVMNAPAQQLIQIVGKWDTKEDINVYLGLPSNDWIGTSKNAFTAPYHLWPMSKESDRRIGDWQAVNESVPNSPQNCILAYAIPTTGSGFASGTPPISFIVSVSTLKNTGQNVAVPWVTQRVYDVKTPGGKPGALYATAWIRLTADGGLHVVPIAPSDSIPAGFLRDESPGTEEGGGGGSSGGGSWWNWLLQH